MAVTEILSRTMRIEKLINYVTNPSKTDETNYTYYYQVEPELAAQSMRETKERNNKTDGIQAFHIIQSFAVGEVTPELAQEIGKQLIKEHLSDYEVVMGTHVDKDHIHNHIAFNSVSIKTGKKYHSTSQSYYRCIRRISDELCRQHGLSIVIETGGKGLSYIEWMLRKAGMLTYREMLDLDVKECLSIALDIGNFYELMENRGYVIEHHSRYPSFLPDGTKAPFRAKQNGRSLTEDDLRSLIDEGLELDAPEVIMRHHRPQYRYPGKLHGFRALYTHWMYVLGIIGNGGRVPYPRVSYKEIRRFEQYKKQQAFLDKNGIDTRSQLEEKRESISQRIEELTKTRIILNSQKKRNKPLYEAIAAVEYLSDVPRLYLENPSGFEEDYARYRQAEKLLEGKDRNALQKERAQLYTRLSDINVELRKLRSEQHLCEVIGHDAPEVNRKLNHLMIETAKSEKEETDAEKHKRTSQRDYGRS